MLSHDIFNFLLQVGTSLKTGRGILALMSLAVFVLIVFLLNKRKIK